MQRTGRRLSNAGEPGNIWLRKAVEPVEKNMEYKMPGLPAFRLTRQRWFWLSWGIMASYWWRARSISAALKHDRELPDEPPRITKPYIFGPLVAEGVIENFIFVVLRYSRSSRVSIGR